MRPRSRARRSGFRCCRRVAGVPSASAPTDGAKRRVRCTLASARYDFAAPRSSRLVFGEGRDGTRENLDLIAQVGGALLASLFALGQQPLQIEFDISQMR